MTKLRNILVTLSVASALILTGCYSNNCPLENVVLCNYKFLDAAGNPIQYTGSLTVSTLMPGYKTVYIYRKLGNVTVTKDRQDSTYIEQGYTETIAQHRNDTILLNNKSGASSISIPMSYFNGADTLVFAYSNISLRDTIKIQHDSYPHVELPECGTYRYHTLKSVAATDASIDHIEIANPYVNYEGQTNINIYFNGIVGGEE